MLVRILVAAALLIAGFGAGYVWVQTLGQQTPEAAPSARSSEFEVGAPAGDFQQAFEKEVKRAPVEYSGIPRVKTLTETAEINSEFLQSAALYQLAAPMSANGIRQLLDDAKKALRGVDYRGASALLIGRYAELDFPAALDYALTSGGQMQASWLRSIFHARARVDIDDALQKAKTLNRNQQQLVGIAMLRSTSSLSTSQKRAIIDALDIPDQLAITAQFQTADAWNETRNIMMRWAQSDPWAAIEASEEIDNQQMLRGIQGQLLALAAADDTQRAIDWVNAQPEGERRDQLTSALVAQVGASDPAQAEALLAGLPEQKRVEAEMALWTRRAATDPEGAAAWVAGLPDQGDLGSFSDYRGVAPMQVLSILGFTAPEAADRFMAALPEKQRGDLGATYVQSLARNNPERASDWIEAQPKDASPELYNALGSSWSQSNVSAGK